VKRSIVLRSIKNQGKGTTKSAFPVLGAPNRRGCAGASCREFGIAKILEKLQLHPHQGRHPVDVDSEACVNFNDARH
jgi:hypothetical protein